LRKACSDLAQAGVDVIAYGCTAGSMVSPLTELSDFMTEVTGVPAVTTAASLIAALRTLGATRISVATPYHDALNEHERAFLADHGVETVRLSGLGFGAHGPEEYKCIARVPAERVYELACSVDRTDTEALLVSCTDFPTLEVIPRLEKDLGKPAVSSNQATFWAALRAAGLDMQFDNFGTLLRDH
jgi:maleate isomerase/arylmalonate decarboxylase